MIHISKKILSTSVIAILAAQLTSCDNAIFAPGVIVADPVNGDDVSIEEHADEWSDTDLEFEVYQNRGISQSGSLVTASPMANLRSQVTKKTSNATRGAVSGAFYWPLFAIHSAVLPDGDVMTYGATKENASNGLKYSIWNPDLGGRKSAHQILNVDTATNLFCSAQSIMPNGQLLITGGDENDVGGIKNDGVREANTFVKGQGVRATAKMAFDRWYPSVVPLNNGEVLVHGGRVRANEKGPQDDTVANVPEIYNPDSRSFRKLSGAASSTIYDKETRGWYYPRSWLNNSGNVFFFKPNSNGFFSLSTKNSGNIHQVGSSAHGNFRLYYPSVMYDKHKVMTIRPNRVTTSISLEQANMGIYSESRLASIPADRIWADATVLADGSVAVSGGSTKRQNATTAVKSVHLYNPSRNKWTKGARSSVARLYHSTAVLLPDASVLMAGGGPPGPVHQMNAEIYYPPYLFKSDGSWANRPSLSGVRGNYRYGNLVNVTTNTRNVSKVSLVRLGSATHSADMTQKFWPINSFNLSNGNLSFRLPTNRDTNAPGYYMLFVIDNVGVPSEAKIFKLW